MANIAFLMSRTSTSNTTCRHALLGKYTLVHFDCMPMSFRLIPFWFHRFLFWSPVHNRAICNTLRGRIQVPYWIRSIHFSWRRHQIPDQTQEICKEAHYNSHQCQEVGRSLIVHVLATVEPPFLAAMQNANMSHYRDTILKLPYHLFTTYAHIVP